VKLKLNKMNMNKKKLFGLLIFISFSIGYSYGQSKNMNLKRDTISQSELSKWKLLGIGEVSSTLNKQVALKEVDGSKGIMLISPNIYKNDVILNFKVMALTPASVIVIMLSASDEGESDELTIPNNYDGSIGFWENNENYFFAFKNAPHNVTPLVRKNPRAKKPLIAAKENHMVAGVYYEIEVGKKQGKLWLSIDGKIIFETIDTNPLAGGHVALRLRGTAGFSAGCLIKDLIISSK